MDSERLSGEYWDQVPHVELSEYASTEKTKADVAALECFLAWNNRVLDLGCGWGRITCELASAAVIISRIRRIET
jgi:cyclopropane fatty-acyl-phospholipid synthase-like methyltransferase